MIFKPKWLKHAGYISNLSLLNEIFYENWHNTNESILSLLSDSNM